ncbi:MAG: chemotaxis protein CheW [Chloroflexi bacterium]|nr:chemotaxis protein CheW [Chloroflexota bacterium]MCH8284298.1 chemotaxis protein CheW [Chloroflexota bacterium]
MTQTSVGATRVEGEERQLVVFDLGGEAYGVEINEVREIIRIQEVTATPQSPWFVEGVINLRGKVIPVVDLRKRFGLEIRDETKDTRIVVVDIANTDIGMIVDAVTEVMRIPMSDVEPPSSVVSSRDSDYLMGIAKTQDKMIILLDLQQVLNGAEEAPPPLSSPRGPDSETATSETEHPASLDDELGG